MTEQDNGEVTVASMFIIGATLWAVNIIKLAHMSRDAPLPDSAVIEVVLRVAGIVCPPIGVVMGMVW